MKKITLLSILLFCQIQSYAAGCPDGSEPEKKYLLMGHTLFMSVQENQATLNLKQIQVARINLMIPKTGHLE